VLADGTYATQSAVEVAAPSAASALGSPNTPNLRTLLLVREGAWQTSAWICYCVC
jgi:hypothetical protein